MKRPADLYERSHRCFPRQDPKKHYPGHFETRQVRSNGEIKWRGQLYFVSEVLAGHPVGLDETDDGIWSLYFGPLLLGSYREDDRSIKLL